MTGEHGTGTGSARTTDLRPFPGTLYAVRTAPRPAGDGWTRCPSVTYGGAPSFWTRRNPDTGAREWYAYNRLERAWRLTRDD